MDYGKIFTRSWEVFWKHKILWVFGILSGLTGVVYTVFSVFRSSNYGNFSTLPYGGYPFSEDTMQILRWAVENTALFVGGIVLMVLVIGLLSLLIGSFVVAAITQANLLVDKGAERLTFSELVESIRPYFWRVLGLNLLLGVGSMGLMFALLAVLMVFGIITMGIGMMCLFPVFCLLVPVMWYLQIVVIQATIAILAEDLGIKDALVRGWNLVKDKIGPYLMVWLLVMVLTMVVSFVLYIPTMIAMAPMYVHMFSPVYMEDPSSIYQLLDVNLISTSIWSIIMMLAMGIFSVFSQSVWVQTFLEAREDGTLDAPEQIAEAEPDSESLEQTT